MDFISLFKFKASNNDGDVGGGKEYPNMFEPIFLSQKQTQLPVKPVWPVTKIFLFFNFSSKLINFKPKFIVSIC